MRSLLLIWLFVSLKVLFDEGQGIMIPEFMEHLNLTMKIVFFADIGFICWYIVLLLVTKNQHRSEPYLIGCIFMCSLAVMLSTAFSIFFFIAISVPLFFFSKRIRYKRTSYYKITKRPYYLTKEDAYLTKKQKNARAKAKGCYGEYRTYTYLRLFEERGNKLLFNLLIPAYGADKTEIDIVMLSPKGIFVFEVKHWSGSISGEEQDQFWTQTLSNGDKYTRYNPIKQNAWHVKCLEEILKLKKPIWSIIVLSGECKLDIRVDNDKVRVVTVHGLKAIIEKIYETADDCISEIEIEELFNDLFPYTQATEEERQKHIENSRIRSNTN